MASSQSFPKSRRILRHSEFERVYRQGRRHSSANLSIWYLAAAGGPQPVAARIGLTVSKALGGAVERNRLKRRMREAVRRHLAELDAAVDVVMNPRKSAATVEFALLEKEVAGAFSAVNRACTAGKQR